MKICEIFSSIEGEGIRQGYLCTFVRTVGCNLRCGDWCDSKYTFKEDSSTKEMTPDQILKACKKFKNEEFFSKYFHNEHAVLPSCAGAFFEGADRDADRMAECGQPAENVFSRA